jgi:hypothetical protein
MAGRLASGTGAAPPARSFYVWITVLLSAMVLLGFWPYFSGLASGKAPTYWIVHLHAAVFAGWLALLLIQAWLVARRRTDLHMQLGRFGIAYGGLVLVLGLVVAIAAPVLNVRDGRWTLDEAAEFLILPLGDMLLFAGFFAAAIANRRQRELHKRLMALATIVMVYPAAARFAFDFGTGAVLAVWLLPLFIAMGHDFRVRGRVEPVYLVGLGVLVVAFSRIWLMETEAWRGIGRHILSAWLPG